MAVVVGTLGIIAVQASVAVVTMVSVASHPVWVVHVVSQTASRALFEQPTSQSFAFLVEHTDAVSDSS